MRTGLFLKKSLVVASSFTCILGVLMIISHLAGYRLEVQPIKAVTWYEQQANQYSPVYSTKGHLLYAIDFGKERCNHVRY